MVHTVLCSACFRITRGSSFKLHSLSSVSKNSDPRICILIKLPDTYTNTHNDPQTGEQSAPLKHVELGPTATSFHFTRASVFHLCAHLSPGEEAANTSDQTSPTQGSGTGETQAEHIPHPPPQELWSMSGEQEERLKEFE